MNNRLRVKIEKHLLPSLAQLGFEILESEQSQDHESASVVLTSGELRVKLECARWECFVSFGSSALPFRWFTDYEVTRHLGIPSYISSVELDAVLEGVQKLLRNHYKDMRPIFSRAGIEETEDELTPTLVAS